MTAIRWNQIIQLNLEGASDTKSDNQNKLLSNCCQIGTFLPNLFAFIYPNLAMTKLFPSHLGFFS
jgi:hypothetical protein